MSVARELHAGIIEVRAFEHSGEPETQPEDTEIVASLGTRGGPLADFAVEPDCQQVDWATYFLPVTYERLLALAGPRRRPDAAACRRCMPGRADDELRDALDFDPRAHVERLLRHDRDAVISVEGL